MHWQAVRIKQGLHYDTNKRVFGALKTMLNHAYKNGYVQINPLDKVTLIAEYETTEQMRERNKKRTYLTESQMKSFLAAMNTYQDQVRERRRNSRAHGKPYLDDLDSVDYVDRTQPMLTTMFYTGFRNGDVITLRWEEINFSFGNITKVLEKTAHKKKIPITFRMPVELKTLLKKWHVQHQESVEGFVFINPKTGNKYGKNALNMPFKKIKEIAGLPDELQPYTLRHNFISWLVMKGIDLLTITKLTGHSDVKMILENYSHLQPEMLDNAVDAFASINRVKES
jgi:integrase